MKPFALRGNKWLAGVFLLTVLLFGCSDDDDPTDPGTPEDPYVDAVVIAPGSAIFTAIGEDLQFDASAYDQDGLPIDTDFTWQSSDDKIVVVGQDGGAVATGLGTAEIYVTTESVVDTADVTVTLPADRCTSGSPPPAVTGTMRVTGAPTRCRAQETLQ